MNKVVLIAGVGLGAAALAYFAYRYMQNPTQTYSTTSTNPQSNGSMTTDPYQTYPFVANVPPRVDNSNQPWANNNRAALNGVSTPMLDVNLSNLGNLSSFLKSGQDIISSGQGIWENISMWMDDGDADWSMQDWSGSDSYNDWEWA